MSKNDYREVKKILEENKEDALKLNNKAILEISEAFMKLYKITDDFNYETDALSLKKYAEALEIHKGKDIYEVVVEDANRDIPMFIESLEILLREHIE